MERTTYGWSLSSNALAEEGAAAQPYTSGSSTEFPKKFYSAVSLRRPRSARRSITLDPVMARDWYRKAARFGSAAAQQRVTQLQN